MRGSEFLLRNLWEGVRGPGFCSSRRLLEETIELQILPYVRQRALANIGFHESDGCRAIEAMVVDSVRCLTSWLAVP